MTPSAPGGPPAVPHLLYHYTTQQGLLGILKEKALWATKVQYMNDATELARPLEEANNVLQRLQFGILKDRNWRHKQKTALAMRDAIVGWDRVNI